MEPVRQTTLSDFNNNRGKLGPDRKKTIDEALLRFTVDKCLPASLVDNKYFKEFVTANQGTCTNVYHIINEFNRNFQRDVTVWIGLQ